MIKTSIWRSKKFRQLDNMKAQMCYLMLHTIETGNSAGCFRLMPAVAAGFLGNGIDPDEAEALILELQGVDLIRWDEEEEIVQIVGFYDLSPPSSRPQLAGPVTILDGLPDCSPVWGAKAELAIAIWGKARNFGPGGADAAEAFNWQARKYLLGNPEAETLFNSLDSDDRRALSSALSIDHPSLTEADGDGDGEADGDGDQTISIRKREKEKGAKPKASRKAASPPADSGRRPGQKDASPADGTRNSPIARAARGEL